MCKKISKEILLVNNSDSSTIIVEFKQHLRILHVYLHVARKKAMISYTSIHVKKKKDMHIFTYIHVNIYNN